MFLIMVLMKIQILKITLHIKYLSGIYIAISDVNQTNHSHY